MGVEVFQLLPSDPVDGAVAFVKSHISIVHVEVKLTCGIRMRKCLSLPRFQVRDGYCVDATTKRAGLSSR